MSGEARGATRSGPGRSRSRNCPITSIPSGLLRLDELAVEELDQNLAARPGTEGVLAQLDHGQQEDITPSSSPDHETELDATPDHGVRLPCPNIPGACRCPVAPA